MPPSVTLTRSVTKINTRNVIAAVQQTLMRHKQTSLQKICSVSTNQDVNFSFGKLFTVDSLPPRIYFFNFIR